MKKTKKLMAGCEVLEAENYCDCGPGEVFRAVLGGTVAGQQVYNALKYFGYRWNVIPHRRGGGPISTVYHKGLLPYSPQAWGC